jgi:PAS domain S-box-containing protein
MMLVSGYSGVGKSALVQELYKPITAKRGYFISGKFDQFQRNIPYSAIVDALRKLIQQLLGEPDDRVEQWRLKLLTALGRNGQIIVDVIPEVELLIGKQPSVPEVGATEAQNRFNRVFQQFIRVFPSTEHPLVIFLDDLQWIDSATLKLIELMLLDGQTQFLFLIGAYRDNEVSPTHPLVLTLDGLRKQGAVLHQIVLSPLTLEPLSKLIAEALHQEMRPVLPLAELVLRKTGGNPFLVGEFLRSLYSEDLLRFDADHLRWRWNLDQIRAANITDNVVELLLNKLKKLPDVSRQLLQLAACIGAEFDLETLTLSAERNSEGTIEEQSPQTVFRHLLAAIQAGLIQPLSELDEDLLVQDYKFLHDRVQQAAYALIEPSQKQVIHLQIGRNLLEKISSEQLTDRLFELVDHLNYGIELVSDQAERDKIAKLNLLAGQKAKKSSAHSAALQYLTTGIELLAADSWQCQYSLTLALHEEATEAAYLCGNIQQMEQRAIVVLNHANTVLDQIKVYETQIQAYAAQGKHTTAIKVGLDTLKLLDVALPETPTDVNVQRQLQETAAYFNTINVDDLLELPLMREPDKLAAMQILSNLIGVTFQAAPSLLPLIVIEQINLSVLYGNTSFSSFAYAAYGGIILNGITRDFEGAYRFGKLALNLVERLDSKELKSKVIEMVTGHLMHCKDHIRQTLPLGQEGYRIGLETGDLEFGAYCALFDCFHLYFAGSELNTVELKLKVYSDVLRSLKQTNVLNYLCRLQQVIYNLTEPMENPGCLSGDSYNEEQILPSYFEVNDICNLCYLYLDKLILSYLFEKNSQALEYAVQTERYLNGVVGTFLPPLFCFYSSLVQIQLYQSTPSSERNHLLLKIMSNQEKMQGWARSAPTNFQHKYALVEAEKARILGQFLEAEDFYEQAVQGAKDNEYLQEEALAYELAAKHYLARGREKFAQTYLKEAHYCYERWGAMAKVKDLEARYPQLLPQSSNAVSIPGRTTTGTSSNTSHTALDLATVMKAAQAISSEIELEQLLRSLMQTLIENAGAQSGCLLLENAGEWFIEAACELHDGESACATQVLQSTPIANYLPESIIQYVIRTNESMILNNATREGNFVNDPYIQRNQTLSLLCLPLLNQSKLVGVLYLENQLVAGAFTPERSQVLNLLSTQAAIAIENAKLYSKLRASESQMAQFLEAIPVGIGIIDAIGRPHYANQQGIQLLGKGVDPSVSPDQLSGAYQFYVTGTDQIYPTERLPIIRALSGERTTIDDIDIHQNNAIIPVEAWGTPVFDEQGNVAYAIVAFRDITERKQAEKLLAAYSQTLERQVAERTLALEQEQAALRQSEATNRAMISAVPDLLIQMSQDGTYLKVVRSSNFQSVNSQQLKAGANVHDVLPPETAQIRMEYTQRALQTGELQVYEQNFVDDDRVYDQEVRIVPSGEGEVLVMVRDISDRKRAEATSILEERNRMAREIHDTLAQAFTGILLQATGANQVLDDLEATQAHLEMIDELARIGLTEARRSVTALRPQLLEEGDLSSALNRLVTQMRSTTNTALVYEIKGTAYSLPAEVENNLLRIGQEALTNANKYAQASEIRVELTYEKTRCVLQVKDDGCGFGMNDAPLNGGFGLLGMSERAANIGAQLAIQSQPGQGTEILVVVGV